MLELRLFTDNDLLLLESWLNKEHVKRWYEIPHMGITIEDWLYEIKHRNDEFKWITYCMVLYDNQPIGFCLYYKCIDSDEDFGNLPLTGAYGIDYLIGEDSYLGKGLGKKLVMLLVNHIFSFLDALLITADTDKNNEASQKTLLSSGFTLLDTERSRYLIHKLNS